MARWKTPRGKKKAPARRGGLFGCVVVVVLLIGFVTWAFFVALNPN
jgi:hypothetical protein